MTGNKVREALHKFAYNNGAMDEIADYICNNISGTSIDGINTDSSSIYIKIDADAAVPLQSIDYYCTIDLAMMKYISSNECKQIIDDSGDDELEKDYKDLIESHNYSMMYNATIHADDGLICIYL